MTGPEQRIRRASLAGPPRPQERRRAGAAQRERGGETVLTAAGGWTEGRADTRKAAPGSSADCRDSAEDAEPGDAAGSGRSASRRGVGLRGSEAEPKPGRRGGGGPRGRQPPRGKAPCAAELRDWRGAGSLGPARSAAQTIK